MSTISSTSHATSGSTSGTQTETDAGIIINATADAFMEGEENGDWGSDNEGEEMLDHLEAQAQSAFSRSEENKNNLAVKDEEMNFVGGLEAEGWSPPGAPEGWYPQARKVEKGEPEFESIDNPGGWSRFNFRPTFQGKGAKEFI
jgi:hypothetical protein